ncbi:MULTISPECIES: ABC transporter permease [unclassified Acinetobacter]|uniref:ABC transporter permease n=1 Tax=unclassified Acinetobacter TaxID=196816 RepID=UPI00257868C6|nr:MULTISPECIES: ABC transporter permease [unclassified Acinetobacter]MDM1765874.1 ABC transporter permease [Acinetobacter sp. 226-1]MDM1769612.1 ABC transporter permease [Acinetobacter sp. 226-4]
MKKLDLRAWVIPILLLLVWSIVTQQQWIDRALLPLPQQVWQVFVESWQSKELFENIGYSLARNTAGFIAGGMIGALFGLFLGLNTWADRFFSPTLNAIKHVAVFAWIPLMIMWFGNAETSKIIFIALVVFYPVFFNTYDGVKNVSEKNKEVAKIFQLSAWSTFFKVILPSAAPSIFAGLNIALVFSWVATIGAEYFFIAAPGVVNPILDGQNLFQMEVVLYGMAIIALVGLVFAKIAQYFENYNLRWRQGTHK